MPAQPTTLFVKNRKGKKTSVPSFFIFGCVIECFSPPCFTTIALISDFISYTGFITRKGFLFALHSVRDRTMGRGSLSTVLPFYKYEMRELLFR